MSIKIRSSVFETNSSSLHSMVMCSDDEYKKLENDQLFIGAWSGKLFSFEEAVKKYVEIADSNDPDISEMSHAEIIDIIRIL